MATTGQQTRSRDDSSFEQPELPLAVEEPLHAICDEFETAWKAAKSHNSAPPRIESYLGGVSGEEYDWLLYELVRLQLQYQSEGRPVREELENRFPESGSLIQKAFTDTISQQTKILAGSEQDTAVDVEHGNGGSKWYCDKCERGVRTEERAPNAIQCLECCSTLSIEKIGRFQKLRILGDGGFGRVYKAYDPNFDECVAIKVPRNWASWSPDVQARFRREARLARELSKSQAPSNIVRVFDFVDDEPEPYIVSEYIDGRTLQDVVAGTAEPDCRQAAEWARQIAEALDYVHAKIIHRDVKPGNILLDGESQARLTDFGLARQVDRDTIGKTVDGHILGTLAYMPPEQAEGRQSEIDNRSDVYSLGVVLYELLTRRTPFEGEDVRRRIREEPPKPPRDINPAVPRDLETICLTCLKKDRSERYQSAAALAADLRAHLNGESIRPPRFGAASRAWRWCKANRMVASLAALLSLLLLAIAVVVSGLRKLDRAKADIADDASLEVIGNIHNELFSRGVPDVDRVIPIDEIEVAPLLPRNESLPVDRLFEKHRGFLVECLQYRVEVLDDLDVAAARFLGVTAAVEKELVDHQHKVQTGAADALRRFGRLADQPEIIEALRVLRHTTDDSAVRDAADKAFKRIRPIMELEE